MQADGTTDDHLDWYAMQLSALGSVPHLRALWYVHRNEPATVNAVADELDVLPETARDKLRRLERVDLVDKSPREGCRNGRVEYRSTGKAITLLSTPLADLLSAPQEYR